LLASTVPNCKSYDPAYAGELAVIVDHGMREMVTEQRDVFYYITITNENYAQQALPEGVEQDVLRGAYLFGHIEPQAGTAKKAGQPQCVTLLGSGAIFTEVLQAARQLAVRGIASDVYSVTSWTE